MGKWSGFESTRDLALWSPPLKKMYIMLQNSCDSTEPQFHLKMAG